MRKYVASSTLSDPQWTNTSVLGDAVAGVRDLKAEEGGDILIYGSAASYIPCSPRDSLIGFTC